MLYSNAPRSYYDKSQLVEVICQLRFPEILSIGAHEPVDFQEAIRDVFPQYAARKEQLPPKVIGVGTSNIKVEPPKPITNYNFVSADGKWKLNLTSTFISLSTIRYTNWETFGKTLDLPLAQFIKIYHPAYFERIGLRYMNIFSRAALGLENTPWRELFAEPYLGVLAAEDIDESRIHKNALDVDMSLDSSCSAHIHAGPGRVSRKAPNAPQDPEIKFILDMDIITKGQLDPRMAAASLEMLHGHSTPLFEGAITDTLRNAMEPR